VWVDRTWSESVIRPATPSRTGPPITPAIIEDALRVGFDPLAAIDEVFECRCLPSVLIVSGLAWDMLDDSTADWFYMQRRALATAGGPDAHRTIEAFKYWWFPGGFSTAC